VLRTDCNHFSYGHALISSGEFLFDLLVVLLLCAFRWLGYGGDLKAAVEDASGGLADASVRGARLSPEEIRNL